MKCALFIAFVSYHRPSGGSTSASVSLDNRLSIQSLCASVFYLGAVYFPLLKNASHCISGMR